jgi:hypothetical protein
MLIIFLVVVEIPLFTSFKQAASNKTKRSDSIDDNDSSSDYILDESEDSYSSSESDNSIDLVQELRQENYIWTAVNEYPLNDDPTKDVEEKQLKRYMLLTPEQKAYLISTINDDQDQEEYHQDQEEYYQDQGEYHQDQEEYYQDQEEHRQDQEEYRQDQEEYHQDQEYRQDQREYHQDRGSINTVIRLANNAENHVSH